MSTEKNIREAIRWLTTADDDADKCITYSKKILDKVRSILNYQ